MCNFSISDNIATEQLPQTEMQQVIWRGITISQH